MAKEIPYFKFYIGEWENGDILLQSLECQAVFIRICNYYWSRDCNLTLNNLYKKLPHYKSQIEELLSNQLIKVDGDNILISFMLEQFNSKKIQLAANRKNGALGGRPKLGENPKKTHSVNFRLAKKNPNGLHIDNNITNHNIINHIEKEKKEKKEKVLATDVAVSAVAKTDVDFDKFMIFFNSIENRKFRLNDKIKKSLLARLKDYSKEEILTAIRNAHKDDYHKETMFKHLTPEFILRPDKIEKFLNLPTPKNQNKFQGGYTPQITN